MEFFVTHQAVDHYSGDCSVAFASKDKSNDNRIIQTYLDLHRFEPKLGNTLMLGKVEGYKSKRVLVVGIGESPLNRKNFIKVLKSLSSAMSNSKVKNVVIPFIEVEDADEAWIQTSTGRVLKNDSYKINKVGVKEEQSDIVLEAVNLYSKNNGATEIQKGVAIANGMALTRELGDLPPNICTPTYIADRAKSLAKTFDLECEILEESDMESLGMNSLLSVSKGSSQPGKLISLKYSNNGNAAPIVLVGKGVTFDSGGISLKPGAGMDEMKYDMCGAASVLGTMKSICELNLKINVVGVIASAENMPSGSATNPGDVVTTMSGQTVEILNTDAEGRLVLCDALTYVSRFKPKYVIDIATLTGAVLVALGKVASGVLSNDEKLTEKLKNSSNISHDYIWELPMWEEFQSELDSNFADIANIGKRYAGTITAACFLSRFTEDYSWAHLDIAGTAWNEGANKGGTGRPVSLLTHFILENAKSL